MDYLSKLDTERFGFKIARVDNLDCFNDEYFILGLKKNGIKLIITRIESKKIDKINKLEDLGFRIKDLQSTYKFDYSRVKIDYAYFNDRVYVRDADKKDVEELMQISSNAFDGYGHYFNNNRLDKKTCLEIYKDWAKRSVLNSDVANKVLVAEYNGKLAGMLSFNFFNKDGNHFGKGGMGAVSSEFRGINIFSTLVIKGLEIGEEMQLDWEEHNVLNTNYPVNRVFSKLGFSVVDSFITMHKWIF